MPIIIDLIVIGLLIGTIIHSISLSKSLKSFKILHSEMMPMMREHGKNLNASLHQIESMKRISGEIDHIINSRVPAALKIKQDLDFLTGRANELADHLEIIIQSGRETEFSIIKKENGPSKERSKLMAEKGQRENRSISAPEEQKKRPDNKAKKTSPAKPFVESFFITKTAKKLFGQKSRDKGREGKIISKDEIGVHHAA